MTRPSVVLLSIDTFRGDCAPGAEQSPHLRSLGLRRPDMASLAAITRGAVAFTRAFSCASYTTACHASLFTGLISPEHGVGAFRSSSLNSEVRTLAEVVCDAGYATCAMSDQPIIFQSRKLLRGFDTFVSDAADALAWWDGHAGSPRFLFLHLWDPHQPYGMPVGRAYRPTYPAIEARWRERLRSRRIPIPDVSDSAHEDIDRYRVNLMQVALHDVLGFKTALEDYLAGLATLDGGRLHDVGAAMRAHGLLDETLLVVAGDHGEGREPPPLRRTGHGTSLMDDQIHIPLFMRVPGLAGVPRITDQVSQADIAPTILDALGLIGGRTAPRAFVSGRSLLPLLRGEALPERPAYAEIWAPLSELSVGDVDSGEGVPGAVPRYRILRYPQRKYWLVGKHTTIGDDMLAAPARELLSVLYRDLLGRQVRPSEVETWLPLIEAIPRADTSGRRALVRRFEAADEFRWLPKYAVHDLQRDPMEQKPINARLAAEDWAEYARQLEIMLDIDRCARPGETMVLHEHDEQVILRSLRALGDVE